MGRVAALLGAPRVIAFGLLAVALGLYYGFHTSLPNTSTWGDVAFLSFLLIPAVLALVYLGLPLRAARELELIAVAIAFAVLAVILHEAGNGGATVYDATTLDDDTRRLYSSVLTGGPYQ